MIIEPTLFYLFAGVAITSALLVISSNNPVHSVMFLILVFCNVSGLLLLLQVEFLAMIFLIVYVGAIAVLFLFVVMMLEIKVLDLTESLIRYLPTGALIGLVFVFEVVLLLNSNVTNISLVPFSAGVSLPLWPSKVEILTNIELLGVILYTHYAYLFIVASLVLLVAMIGAIVLTLHKDSGVKRQDIFSQVSRNVRGAVRLS